MLLQWRRQRHQADEELSRTAAAATDAFEALHEKSHLVALLSGDRDHPVGVGTHDARDTPTDVRGDPRSQGIE